MSLIELEKQYPINKLECINFWNLTEPDGIILNHKFSNNEKYVVFRQMNLSPSSGNYTFARRINYLKRTIIKTQIIYDILDKTIIYMPEIKKIIRSFIGIKLDNSTYACVLGRAKSGLTKSDYFQISNFEINEENLEEK